MKKLLFPIFILNCLIVQAIIGQDIPSPQYNKRYTTIRTPHSTTDSLASNYAPDRVLKIIPALWKIELDTIYNDSFPLANIQSVLSKEYARQWQWKASIPSNCLESKREDCLYFKTVESRRQMREVRFTPQDSFKVVEVKKFVADGRLEWVEDDFPEVQFDENKAFKAITEEGNRQVTYIKVKAGIWTEWKEIACRSINLNIVNYQLQHALKERGYYNGELDNRLNDELRMAIMQFKKENGISVCDYNPLTTLVRALEIEY